MSARFTIIRGSDKDVAGAFLRRLAIAADPANGAAQATSAFNVANRPAVAIACALARRLLPSPAALEVRAFRHDERGLAAVPLPDRTLTEAAAKRILADGATLVFQKVDARSSSFSRLARSLELATGQPAQINIYVGAARTCGLDWHRDPHDVLILHLAGSKRFLIGSAPDGGAADCVQMHPGDVLWLPRGTRHAAENGDAGSVHAAVGLLHLVGGPCGLMTAADATTPSASTRCFQDVDPAVLGATMDFLMDWRVLPEPGKGLGRLRLRPDLLAALVEDGAAHPSIRIGRREAPLPRAAVEDLTAGRTPEDPEALMALDCVSALSYEPAAGSFIALVETCWEDPRNGC